jgi:hypothetical protein
MSQPNQNPNVRVFNTLANSPQSEEGGRLLEWSMWSPLPLSLNHDIVVVVVENSPSTSLELEKRLYIWANTVAEKRGLIADSTAYQLLDALGHKFWRHLKEVYGVSRPEQRPLPRRDDERREFEVKVLREILERELRGRTVAEVANGMVRFREAYKSTGKFGRVAWWGPPPWM